MRDVKWSDREKKVAKHAFDNALEKECVAILETLKAKSANAKDPDDIWAIHDYLSEQRKSINEKYDYRYSQLIFVFGQLLREKWIEDQDLEGLSEEKLQAIHTIASL